MIPNNIKKEDILNAIKEIDKNGIPKNRYSKKFSLKFKGKLYPPKYVIAIANKFANGEILESSKFEGGKETNHYLQNLGFEIINHTSKNNILLFSIIIQYSNRNYNVKERINIIKETLKFIIKSSMINSFNRESPLILLFPAGWFRYKQKITNNKYSKIKNEIVKIIKQIELKRKIIICAGIDGNFKNKIPKDQIAFAIDEKGFKAVARKFYPTNKLEESILKKSCFVSTETINNKNYNRYFDIYNKKFYLLVCYDIFGIKKQNIQIPKFNNIILLNLIHEFSKGQSEANFVRHGLAGASGKWKRPVFGSVIFYKNLPSNWPSGVFWTENKTRVPECTYENIMINPIREDIFNFSGNITILLRLYNL